MTESCQQWRGSLAGFVFGQLSQAERTALTAHLDGCAACRQELAELSATATMLAAADPDRLDTWPQPPVHLREQLFAQIGAERRAATRRRRTALVGAAAAMILAVVAVSIAATNNHPTAERVAFTAPAGVHAEAGVQTRPWGTQITVDATGLPAGQTNTVWLERADGTHVAAGTFTGVANRTVHVVLAAGLPRRQAVAIGVGDPNQHTLLRAELT